MSVADSGEHISYNAVAAGGSANVQVEHLSEIRFRTVGIKFIQSQIIYILLGHGVKLHDFFMSAG